MSPAPLLEVHDLTLRFGGVTALNRVSFEVLPGELFAVIRRCRHLGADLAQHGDNLAHDER